MKILKYNSDYGTRQKNCKSTKRVKTYTDCNTQHDKYHRPSCLTSQHFILTANNLKNVQNRFVKN